MYDELRTTEEKSPEVESSGKGELFGNSCQLDQLFHSLGKSKTDGGVISEPIFPLEIHC